MIGKGKAKATAKEVAAKVFKEIELSSSDSDHEPEPEPEFVLEPDDDPMENAPPKPGRSQGGASSSGARKSKRPKVPVVKFESSKFDKKPAKAPAAPDASAAAPVVVTDASREKRGRGPNGEKAVYKKKRTLIDCTGDGLPVEKFAAKEGVLALASNARPALHACT